MKKQTVALIFSLFSFTASAEDLQINPPRELDFLNREEIFSVRREMMRRYPLLNGDYTPQGPVYAQVVGGKEWLGISGINCRTGKEGGITSGLSRESIFIDNPVLLIGITTGGFSLSGWNCPDIYPMPTRIFFEKERSRIYADYDFSSYQKMFQNYFQRPVSSDRFKLQFTAENARDLGFSYGYVSASENMVFPNPVNIANTVFQFKDFVHLAYNLGCACNNGSPNQPELDFSFTRLPAEVRFKLWKEKPSSPKARADMIFEMKIN